MAWEQETGLEARFPPLTRVGSSSVFVPPRDAKSAGCFPEQRLVIEPTGSAKQW